MPILKIINMDDAKEAVVENNAQVNKIEDIQIDGVSLEVDGKKINIPLATDEDISSLFKKEEE